MSEKTNRKVTGKLIGKMYDCTLFETVNVLTTQANRWWSQEIDAFALKGAIRKHYNRISRDLSEDCASSALVFLQGDQ